MRSGLGLERGRVPRLAAAVALLVGSACNTQIWPKPMVQAVDPLPPGVLANTTPGQTEVLLIRHADPVQVRLAGSQGAFPLTHYRKRQRVWAGTWMHCGAGGRAELLWVSDGATVVVFDEALCSVGDLERGEPSVRFETLTRAEIELAPGALVQLPGGSLLSGPPTEPTGPYLVQHIYDEMLRVFNQSRSPAYLAFREERITLGPGERIDLPLLGEGGAPFQLGGPPVEIESAGIRGAAYGDLTVLPESAGIRARSQGEGRLVGNGVIVHLAAGEEAALLDLGDRAPAPPAP